VTDIYGAYVLVRRASTSEPDVLSPDGMRYDVITKERTDAERVPQSDVLGTSYSPVERAEQCRSSAIEAGQRIAEEVGNLDRRELSRIVRAFRSQLLPPRKPGRRRNKEITAAHADWQSGLRGVALYRKHIPRFDQMSRWRRQAKIRALMDAIRSRERRARKRARNDQPVSLA
jgi:hypothetical protein